MIVNSYAASERTTRTRGLDGAPTLAPRQRHAMDQRRAAFDASADLRLEPCGDGRDVEVAASHGLHEALGLVDGEVEVATVEQAENTGRGPGESLVAVGESVVSRERVHERRRLLRERWVRVFTEGGGLGPTRGRDEQTPIVHDDFADDSVGDLKQIRDAQVLDPPAPGVIA